jgi:acetyltransferase-like isoleucine patch superfamily enzyme
MNFKEAVQEKLLWWKLRWYEHRNGMQYLNLKYKNHPRYTIGDFTYGYPKIYDFFGTAWLRIGKFCSISDNVIIILDGTKSISHISVYPLNHVLFSTKTHSNDTGIYIGNDVWIGTGVTILQNINIGDGAIIGAGAVVTKNVKEYEVVGGIPANHIKFRFNEQETAKLLEMQWWNWDIKMIKRNLNKLQSGKVNELFEEWKARKL